MQILCEELPLQDPATFRQLKEIVHETEKTNLEITSSTIQKIITKTDNHSNDPMSFLLNLFEGRKEWLQRIGDLPKKLHNKLIRKGLSIVGIYETIKKENKIDNDENGENIRTNYLPESNEQQNRDDGDNNDDARIDDKDSERENYGDVVETINETTIEEKTIKINDYKTFFKVPYYFTETKDFADNNDEYSHNDSLQKKRLQKIGYSLKGILGGGTHGKVFSAITNKGRNVAIKICSIKRDKKNCLESSIMEAYIMKKLSKKCPFITPAKKIMFYSSKVVGTSGLYFYVIMPQANYSLQGLINEGGPLEENGAQQCLAFISMGLRYLHENGIAHRDLKLANVLATIHKFETKIRLADFGMSLFVKTLENGLEYLSKGGGTLSYMSPQLIDAYIKCRENKRPSIVPYNPFPVDLWALGVCFYVMLFGQTPFGKQPCEKEKKIEFAKWMLFKQLQCSWIKYQISDMFSVPTELLLLGLLHSNVDERLMIHQVLGACCIKRYLI